METKERVNIFIVDDNKVFATTLKSVIETAFEGIPIHVSLFDTGEGCLEEFEKILPELVILDYSLDSKLPGAADGLKVLDSIKSYHRGTDVIMLTSNELIDIAVKSFNYGASDYVVKTGKQFENIVASICKLFSKRELAMQNYEKERQAKELIMEHKEREIESKEKEKWAGELTQVNNQLIIQNQENERRNAELADVSKELAATERSKTMVEEANKDLTDSLNYAWRIQQAKLPSLEEIRRALPDVFVLFKPKLIVSGDFYFFAKTASTVFIAAADCTGHGVPGAFMSMIGSEKLNEAVSTSEDVSEILSRLNTGIKTSLRQTGNPNSSKDGMDIAICSINTETNSVKFAGANRPLWIVRNGSRELEEIKATKRAIGGYTEDDQHFETHELQLKEGDSIYVFSDGYADCFGGPFGKKLMTRKFKEVLLSIQDKSMTEQQHYLDRFIEDWKGEVEQVDDILVIGIRM